MADKNRLYEKVMIYYRSRLDVQFVKKIPLAMIIGHQLKEEGNDQNY